MPRSPPCSVGCPRLPPASSPSPGGCQISRTPCRSLPTCTAVWPAQWRGDGARRRKGSTSLALRGGRGAEAVREDVLDEDLARPQLPDLVRGPEAAAIPGVSTQRLHALAAEHPGPSTSSPPSACGCARRLRRSRRRGTGRLAVPGRLTSCMPGVVPDLVAARLLAGGPVMAPAAPAAPAGAGLPADQDLPLSRRVPDGALLGEPGGPEDTDLHLAD